MEHREQRRRWATSGALALTGWPDGPLLGPPLGLVPHLDEISASIAASTAHLGRRVAIDPLDLLVERAALAGLGRGGQVSCGQSTRLLRAADGWLAVTLARASDVELVPAWLGGLAPDDEPAARWAAVSDAVGDRSIGSLVTDGVLLGLPVAAVPTPQPVGTGLHRSPVMATEFGSTSPAEALTELTVVDLSSLWAGPLCASLLADAGATVIKVESTSRPDGTRKGPVAVFDLYNAGKRAAAFDFACPGDIERLRALLSHADVVIESARPRGLEQLGIVARDLLVGPGPRVWVSITGHGRGPDDAMRVGFGDDAAAAGGLVAWHHDQPCFVADAIADPLTALVATEAILDALRSGGRWLLDVALRRVAEGFAAPTLAMDGEQATPPRARRNRGPGPRMGADTAAVLADIAAFP